MELETKPKTATLSKNNKRRMNKNFFKEDGQMARRCMGEFSASLIMKEMQIGTMKDHITLRDWHPSPRTQMISAGMNERSKKSSTTVLTSLTFLEDNMDTSQKILRKSFHITQYFTFSTSSSSMTPNSIPQNS